MSKIYAERFDPDSSYRNEVWRVLATQFFQRFVPLHAAVLDLGCGYGQFINHIACGEKYAMDLNPNARTHLKGEVQLLEQDCAKPWPLRDRCLDVVFSSNFFEHLPDKAALEAAIREAKRCLRPGGVLIAMSPNIRYVGGCYWDFWDHHIPLSERSLAELLTVCGFRLERTWPRFLPYTMAGRKRRPTFLVSAYLKMPWVWRFLGKQFLVIARS